MDRNLEALIDKHIEMLSKNKELEEKSLAHMKASLHLNRLFAWHLVNPKMTREWETYYTLFSRILMDLKGSKLSKEEEIGASRAAVDYLFRLDDEKREILAKRTPVSEKTTKKLSNFVKKGANYSKQCPKMLKRA